MSEDNRLTTGEKVIATFVIVFMLYLFSHLMFALGKQSNTNNFRCEEDMACWNCETMGNMICGPRERG